MSRFQEVGNQGSTQGGGESSTAELCCTQAAALSHIQVVSSEPVFCCGLKRDRSPQSLLAAPQPGSLESLRLYNR